MDKSNRYLLGGLIIVGLGLVANTLYTVWSVGPTQTSIAVSEATLQPTFWYDNNFVSPVATKAAPRMYVSDSTSAGPPGNPGESWLQGGRASITNTTGRWAQ